jgi:hypothetical protein
MHACSNLTSPPPPPRTALHIIRMRQQKLAARKRILARFRPGLVLADAQLDALVVDLVLADLIRQTHATRDGRPYAAQPARRMHALRLDELAQLPQTLEEGNHGRVDLAVREAEGDGEVARREQLEAVPAHGGGRRPRVSGRGPTFVLEAHDRRRRAHGVQLVAREFEVQTLCQRGEQEAGLAPCGIELGRRPRRRPLMVAKLLSCVMLKVSL